MFGAFVYSLCVQSVLCSEFPDDQRLVSVLAPVIRDWDVGYLLLKSALGGSLNTPFFIRFALVTYLFSMLENFACFLLTCRCLKHN